MINKNLVFLTNLVHTKNICFTLIINIRSSVLIEITNKTQNKHYIGKFT